LTITPTMESRGVAKQQNTSEDDGLRVPIEDRYKFLYEVLRRDGWNNNAVINGSGEGCGSHKPSRATLVLVG